jgi:hypothetical protein
VAVSGGGSGGDIGAEKYFEEQHSEVVLPNAKRIKKYAFYSDTVLNSIEIPNAMVIGMSAFSGCSNLVSVLLSNSLNRLDTSAFANCGKLALASLPDGLIIIGDGAFQYNSKINVSHIPKGVTNINGSAFRGCSSITSMTFEGKPLTIASSAFNGCTNLTVINVPWAEGEVAYAPWGATNATINYNYTG